MKTIKNYVKLLGKMDYRREAWKTSRPKFKEENLHFDKVEEMDLSLNSMLVYTIEMRSSVIVRDLIFSLRPMEGWALSTRSMPINRDTIQLSSEFKDDSLGQEMIDNFFDALDEGQSRDKARDKLPLNVSSTYTFTIDYRVLISLVRNLKLLNKTLYKEYGLPLLQATGISLDQFDKSTVKSSLEYYIIEPIERISGIKRSGNIIHGHYSMKTALASQFLRQHYSKIKIGFWNIAKDYESLNMSQGSMIDIVFYIDTNSYDRLMAMRSHWVIDHSMDMWGGIVGDYIKDMTTEEFWNFTPAGGGKKDPYWADCYNRVLLEDPGVPCPIMTECRDMIMHRRQETGDNPILDMYGRLFDEGFVKDNINNEHREKYFKLLGGE